MAHVSLTQQFAGLTKCFKRVRITESLKQCKADRSSRGFASIAPTIVEENVRESSSSTTPPSQAPKQSSVLTTLHSWPSFEPSRYAWYGSQYLDMPLRKDILHRAVVYEGDATRQGTASTKWRADVHGSNRKIAPQKGLGRARVGDKKSPSRRGGGVAFGPHPRDFSTELPRKIYDIAWRTALSHRYRKGELILLDSAPTIPDECSPRLLHNIFTQNQWGKGFGRSLIVSDTDISMEFYESMAQVGEHGVVKDLSEVDVKDLLKFGRVIIDTVTLNTLFAAHSYDLGRGMSLEMARQALGSTWELESNKFVQYADLPTPSL